MSSNYQANNAVNPVADSSRKPWSAPRLIESEIARRTAKTNTTFTANEFHLVPTTNQS